MKGDIRKIDLSKRGLPSMLSDTESMILEILWDMEEGKVRDIHNKLKKKHKVALTTVGVYLDKLYEKKLVSREVETCRGGLRYIYKPKLSKGEFTDYVTGKVLTFLRKSFGEASIAYLKDKLEE
jgi:predicted transcriptional regulator